MNDVLAGILSVLTPSAMLLMTGGTILGIVFGALPGLSATTGIALCLPLTYKLGSTEAIALLIGIYVGNFGLPDLCNPYQRPWYGGIRGHHI